MKLNSLRGKKMLESTIISDAKKQNKNSAIKMMPGFVARVQVRCGKSNCRCNRKTRHIAYYHVTYSSGVRVRKYLRRDQVAMVRAACKAHRELQQELRAGRAKYRQTLARLRELLKLFSL
jgi:hypothetical protein